MSDPSQSNDPPVPSMAPRNEPQVVRFVSKIKNLDMQIGEHVLGAL